MESRIRDVLGMVERLFLAYKPQDRWIGNAEDGLFLDEILHVFLADTFRFERVYS
jgi:hypothetical protein